MKEVRLWHHKKVSEEVWERYWEIFLHIINNTVFHISYKAVEEEITFKRSDLRLKR